MKEPSLTSRQHRLLQRIIAGDCPRASHREYHDLCTFDVRLRDNLQMESALGADTRGGYIITALHTPNATVKACRAVLADNPPPPPVSPLKPDPRVLDKNGNIKSHVFEPPHDDPGPGPCWYCLKPKSHRVHV